ncbi:S24 family peptidase [uncultured Alistipes sp.]|jgi:hypothetical protein|uniref:S24 family peptidase n=1 Tax=uncultured Alistipes sp. TaxID=538949 RepID=UPI0025E229CB|nr:S24 family peptidase [uncultured Alistipes sp.]
MVSERLGKYIDYKGISYYAFENSLGVSRGSISKAVKERKNIGSNVLENILTSYNDLNPRWLLTGRGTMLKTGIDTESTEHEVAPQATDTLATQQSIPIYDILAGGRGSMLFEGTLAPVKYVSLPDLPKCDGAIYMRGDTMTPDLYAGDIVVYKLIRDLRNGLFLGQMYLLTFEINEEEYLMIKYIHASDNDGHVKLVSSNGHYPPKDIPFDSIKAMAMIKASVRYTTMI